MRTLCCGLLCFLLAAPAAAQDSSDDSRPALPTFHGDTGLWFVPTAETLPPANFAISGYRSNVDRSQGLTDVGHLGITGAIGVTDRIELFGSWRVVRLRRNVSSPLFGGGDPSEYGGVDAEYPYLRDRWSKTLGSTGYVGAKVNLLSQSRQDALGVAIRGMVGLPAGPPWASTNSVESRIGLVLSRELQERAELTASVGGVFRQDPDEFSLSDGVSLGVGLAFPTRSPLRALVEFEGELMTADAIVARSPPRGADGSRAATNSAVHNPAAIKLGALWQSSYGAFVHGGVNYSFNSGDQTIGGVQYEHTGWGFDVRIGFHPGSAVYVPPPPPPPAIPPPPPPAPAANRNPTLGPIMCDPCIVEVGQTSRLSVVGSDPDNEPLTYMWSAPTGTFATPTAPNTVWTAPNQVGNVPVQVTASDPRGGQATATTTLQVIRPPVKQIVFEDVHFDFDRYNLKPEAIKILDQAAQTLAENPELRVTIEGHCDSIGTVEYNLALGTRRSTAARDYLVSRGVAASRLETVSYGEERPKADNATAEGRALNRRAALVVNIQ